MTGRGRLSRQDTSPKLHAGGWSIICRCHKLRLPRLPRQPTACSTTFGLDKDEVCPGAERRFPQVHWPRDTLAKAVSSWGLSRPLLAGETASTGVRALTGERRFIQISAQPSFSRSACRAARRVPNGRRPSPMVVLTPQRGPQSPNREIWAFASCLRCCASV